MVNRPGGLERPGTLPCLALGRSKQPQSPLGSANPVTSSESSSPKYPALSPPPPQPPSPAQDPGSLLQELPTLQSASPPADGDTFPGVATWPMKRSRNWQWQPWAPRCSLHLHLTADSHSRHLPKFKMPQPHKVFQGL